MRSTRASSSGHSSAIRPRSSSSTPRIFPEGLANSLDWLAQIQVSVGDLQATLETQRAAFDLRRRLVEMDPEDTDAALMLTVAHNTLGFTLANLGRDQEALIHHEADVEICRRLVDHDPQNAQWRRSLGRAEHLMGEALARSGRVDEALIAIDDALRIAIELHALDPENLLWKRDVWGTRVTRAAVLVDSTNRRDEALRIAGEAAEECLGVLQAVPDDAEARLCLVRSLLIEGRALRENGRTSEALERWNEALGFYGDDQDNASARVLDAKSRLLLHLDRKAEARVLAEELLKKGYRRTDYVSFLKKQNLDSVF